MKTEYIDWHTHTRYSDGLDDPKTVVRNSKLLGIESLAITDHDTLAGAWEAKEEADKWNIHLIPGVEVSTEIYHILGLGFNPSDKRFNNFLKKVRDLQEKICEQRIELLQKEGFPIDLETMKSHFNHPEQRLGKYNVFMSLLLNGDSINYLADRGFTGTNADFQTIFGKKGIAGTVEKKYFVTSKEAIYEIHLAGGKAIVAHPFKQAKGVKDLDVLVEEGLDGLEIQPNFGERNIEFEKYASEKGLLITYGSDYHGSAFTRPLLGRANKGYNNRIDTMEFFRGKDVRR